MFHAGEAITHRCPRCSTLVNQCCLLEELTEEWVPIVHETDRGKFLHALDGSLPGMTGRMFLDEALDLRADWTRLRSSAVCIACVAEIRCCQVLHPLRASFQTACV